MNHLIDIAKELEEEFKHSNYDVYSFHSLAAKALEKVDLDRISSETVYKYLENELKSHQFMRTDRFGEPSITLYMSNEILLDILVWTSSDTNIHSHGFTGAFRVLEGDSIQAVYKAKNNFTPPYSTYINDKVELDYLRFLKKGNIQEIPTGLGLIHKSMHLKHPTLNLIFRTLGHRERELGICQHTIILPEILTESHPINPILFKKFSFINALIKSEIPNAINKLNLAIKDLTNSELLFFKQNGLEGANCSIKSLEVFKKSIDKELERRNLFVKLEESKNYEINQRMNHEIATFNFKERVVFALIESHISLNEMNAFIDKNKIKIEKTELLEIFIKNMEFLNKNKLLKNSLNETAFEIFSYLVQGHTEEQILEIFIETYEAPKESLSKDIKSVFSQLNKDVQLSKFLSQ